MARTVVVGIDGTASSHEALIWAAETARSRRDELEIVYALGIPGANMDLLYDDAVNQTAEELLAAESVRALEVAPGLTLRTTLSRRVPGQALTEASAHAALVVVGSRPLGALERVVSGSLSYQVAAGALCPVVVVPSGTGTDGVGVVVGVDGSPDSLEAVALAAAEADRSGQELTVVHAWRPPRTTSRAEGAQEREHVLLAESVAGLSERYPDLVVNRRIVSRQAAQALLEAAKSARLLVVGSRGREGVARMLLGSVSHTVVLHATCPVLVVRT
ncbi:universal stress protein [Pengzhenrongella sp.]|jgi:nucleotide-binding universal stress UspA family protein|uniref:universal stress protein n=1 Tax=Pengzhenrongella sp. TaxID=2888820 RepID=UPI002F9208A8